VTDVTTNTSTTETHSVDTDSLDTDSVDTHATGTDASATGSSAADGSTTETGGAAEETSASDGTDGDSTEAPTATQLEEEGDIAADYIEELLDIADLDGDIDIDARGGRAYLSVNSSEGSSNLDVLSKPDTVNALQELTRIAVQTKTGSFSRLILDVGGSREARASELGVLVDKAISRIDDGAESASLPAMSSYERKLVHDIVSERGYVSESEGEGRDRHTVITRK
jgi:spoIIIJ-associated protein